MFPALRPRANAQNPETGALSRIVAGAFGRGAPTGYVFADVDPSSIAPSMALYHEGDLFTPGAENFVYEPTHELPVHAIWGGGSGVNQGLLFPVNAWPVYQPPQVWADLRIPTAGYGGLQAGAFVGQPLLDDSE